MVPIFYGRATKSDKYGMQEATIASFSNEPVHMLLCKTKCKTSTAG